MGNRTYHPRGELVDGYRVQDHPLYSAWAAMLGRCTNPNVPEYKYYGARGISVCDRWTHFRYFAEDMGIKESDDLSLERIDVNGNYEPSNCMWATNSQQAYNRRMFSNNTSGVTGVSKKDGSWVARLDYEGVRYNIGWYKTKEEAVAARLHFEDLFFVDKDAAIKSIDVAKARWNSKTGERGINPHVDGGYLVRLTHEGKRHYIGYFSTLDEAKDAKRRFLEERA